MKTVKYRCQMCGHSEDLRWYHRVGSAVMTGFFVVGLMVSTWAVVMLVQGHNPAGLFASVYMNSFALAHDDSLREAADTMTVGCEGGRLDCYIESVYANMSHLPYRPSSRFVSLYNPEYVLEHGGDCRNTAATFTGIMTSLGFEAHMVCNSHHCISAVPDKGYGGKRYDQYYIVDFAFGFMAKANSTEAPWDAWNRLSG